MNIRNLIISFAALVVLFPGLALAHQPRVMEGNLMPVDYPEISKAYYAQLNGKPQVYVIDATSSFNLYVNILLPDIANNGTEITAKVSKNGRQIALLEGGKKIMLNRFYEPFAGDYYLRGQEYKAKVGPGIYTVEVSSPDNKTKYSLAIGEIEAFDFKETKNAIKIIPWLKKNFFEKSPATFVLSIFGAAYLLVMFLLVFIAGFIYRLIVRKVAKNFARRMGRNIGKADRLIRFLLGILLLVLAITTTWNPIILFFSGFCLFEAIFSWCGLYAALGKNTCPLN